MGRRKNTNGFDTLTRMPWPIGIAAGAMGFVTIRFVIPWWFARQDNALANGMASNLWQALEPIAWIFLAGCWLAALLSFLGARCRRQLLDTRTTLDSLASPGWRQFEQLVGEAFRRQGYRVEESGLGGPDGGVDLILQKQDRRVLVQCKQWRRRQVGVSVVREMVGLLAHHQADAVKIVCVGTFTPDAEAFARGKPIELIGGEQLLQMIQQSREPNSGALKHAERREPALAPTVDAPMEARSCPRCGSPAVKRTNRNTGAHFFGCSRFPRCRGVAA